MKENPNRARTFAAYLLIAIILPVLFAGIFYALSAFLDQGQMPSLFGLGFVVFSTISILLTRFVVPVILFSYLIYILKSKNFDFRLIVIQLIFLVLSLVAWIFVEVPI